jgi:hypothetical protein
LGSRSGDGGLWLCTGTEGSEDEDEESGATYDNAANGHGKAPGSLLGADG